MSYFKRKTRAFMSLSKPIVMPVKGDIISMTIEGTKKYYRVFKTHNEDNTLIGNQVEVYSMTNYRGNCQYANTSSPATTTFGGIIGPKYEGSNIDTYYNTTFYNNIKNNATGVGSYKVSDAIVDRTIVQGMYKWSYNVVSGKTNYRSTYISHSSPYSEDIWEERVEYVLDGYGKAASGSIVRKIYIPDTKDILEYLGATTGLDSGLTGENFSNMLYNIPSRPAFNANPFLRSAYDIVTASERPTAAMGVGYQGVAQKHVQYEDARPMFAIDLDKVAFEIYEEPADITDLTNCVWVGNRELTPFSTDKMFNVKVNCNEVTYNTFGQATQHIGTSDLVYMMTDNYWHNYCFDDGDGRKYWLNERTRTVEFVSGSDVTNTDLIAWLKANGTLKRNLYSEVPQGETWLFDESVVANDLGIDQVNIEFTCDGVKYFGFLAEDELFFITANNQFLSVLNRFGVWEDEKYRTVVFETAPTGDLRTWLQANATLQS